jgi:hypothetical protein
VTEGNYFVERAVRSLGLKSEVLSPQQYAVQQPAAESVIIFDQYAPPRLPEKGRFLFFGVVPPGEKLAGAAADKAGPIKDIAVKGWKRDHPVLRDLDLGKLYVAEAMKLDPPAGWDVLVEGAKGPLVVARRGPGRSEIVVAFDTTETNWPLKSSFPVFLYQATKWLAQSGGP